MKRSEAVAKINGLSGDKAHNWVVDTYNSITPRPRGYKLQTKDPWCAATISAVFHALGYDDLAECSCPVMIQKAKELGIWHENDDFRPQAGDLILYDWQDSGKGDDVGVADHIGMVVKVDGDKMIVREGNKSGKMGNRTININARYIRGFITPPYEAQEGKEDAPATNSTPAPEKPADGANSEAKAGDYEVGKTYTVSVNSALNVRKGAGKNYGLVGYAGLTSNAKKHATKGGALLNGTRVDCLDLKQVGGDTWMLIPSGWICAKSGNNVYVK